MAPKKPAGAPVRKGADLMKQMGFFSEIDVDGGGVSGDDDTDLEAELLRLEGGKSKEAIKPARRKGLNLTTIEKLVADIDNDAGSDDELSGNEDELLKELEALSSASEEEETEVKPRVSDSTTLLSLLTERLESYKQAATSTDASRKRRAERGFKTLQTMIQDVKSGKAIDESEIPPPMLAVKTATSNLASATQSSISPSLLAVQDIPKQSETPSTVPVSLATFHNTTGPAVSPGKSSVSQASTSRDMTPPRANAVPFVDDTAAPLQDPRLARLVDLRNQYHAAVLQAKHTGNEQMARKLLKTQKDFDRVIEAVKEGKDVDLSNIPPPPPTFQASVAKGDSRLTKLSVAPSQSPLIQPTTSLSPPAAPIVSLPRQATPAVTQQPQATPAVAQLPQATAESSGSFLDNITAPSAEEAKSLFNAPDAPADILSALVQRLQKYQEGEKEANEQNNASKARRMGRIVKQYEDAIKAHKAGRPVDYTELPTPPGFAPIPVAGVSSSSADAAVTSSTPAVVTAPASMSLEPPKQNQKRSSSPPKELPSSSSVPPAVLPKAAKLQASLSIQQKQLEELQLRQTQYKKAALDAKTHDDKELALKYMRIAKGMEPMISAASNGLPVDMSQLPPPPMADHDPGFVIIDKTELPEVSNEDRVTEYKKIEEELRQQIQSAVGNAQHFKKMGDVKNSFLFENLEQNCRKDLDSLKNAFTHKDPVPKYHYETRQYTKILMNSDLGDGDLEVSILRGIQYPLPSEYKQSKDLDTQVVFEFPFPQEEGQKGQTEWCKHTDNPEYHYTTKLKIDRKSKTFLRVIKNKKLKLEIIYHRGFLKGSKPLATVSIKLDVLETKATVHESYDLLDINGRKEIGGKLELKLRMREPLLEKQVEVVQEKWLVIDQFVRLDLPVHKDVPIQAKPGSSAALANIRIQSIEILKFEKKELDAKIRAVANQLSPSDLARLTDKSAELASDINGIVSLMKSGALTPHAYIQQLSQIGLTLQSAMEAAQQSGDRKRLQLLIVKRDVLRNEIKVQQARMGLAKR